MSHFKGSLKQLVRILKEADEDLKESGEDSIDDQIDRYFSDYESEAKKSKNEGLDFRMMTRRFLIETDEDKDDKKTEEETKLLTAEDIDINSFITDVMRLVDNYDSLLEVKNTILRRAVNYLNKSYEQDVSQLFKEQLVDSYGIEIGLSKMDREEEFQAPRAGAAGPASGGGGT